MDQKLTKVFRISSYVILVALGVLFLGYLIVRTSRNGNDINVYLHAAQQLLAHQNIYIQNPFNFYLYSPLFALALSPLTYVEMPVARVIWMLVNVILAVRTWILLRDLVSGLAPGRRALWTFCVVVLSLGFLNHNFMLGQVTILILWLTIEGMVQTERGHTVLGSVLIALGINVKILPMFVLVWLGMRGRVKAVLLIISFFILSLLLPSVLIGFQYNTELLVAWKSAINPAGERFAFEDNDGCHSLNAVLPAYFFDFNTIERTIAPYQRNVDYPRLLTHVPYTILHGILQICRVMLLVVFIIALLPRSWMSGPIAGLPQRLVRMIKSDFNKTQEHAASGKQFLLWEIALLCLLTLLIFPHQMKYSMLYFVPAGGYVIFYLLKHHFLSQSLPKKITFVVSVILLIILAMMGRDIIGNHLVDILDYYHFMGISNLLFVGILWVLRPEGENVRT